MPYGMAEVFENSIRMEIYWKSLIVSIDFYRKRNKLRLQTSRGYIRSARLVLVFYIERINSGLKLSWYT